MYQSGYIGDTLEVSGMFVSTSVTRRTLWVGPGLKLLYAAFLAYFFCLACKPKHALEEPASQAKGFSAISASKKLGEAIFSYGDYTQSTIRSVTKDWQTNIAKGKRATASSVADHFDPEKAVDGNTNGLLDADSVSLTSADPAPWWQVDLGHDHAVSAVTIWARTDCCTGDLAGARVELVDANGRVVTRRPLARRAPIIPAQGIPLDGTRARFVRVVGTPNKPLALAEVEVWEKALSVGQGVCWKRSQGRGVGTPLTTCSDSNPDKNG